MGQEIGNFKPLEIIGLTPNWVHYSFDSTIVGHQIPNPRADRIGFDGYGHVYIEIPAKHIIKDNYWYKISNTDYDVDISGGLIEKIDLSSGKVVWFFTFDKREQEFRECVHHAELNGEILTVFSLRITSIDSEIALPSISFFEKPGVLVIRQINIKTGELINKFDADPNADNVKIFRSSFNNQILIRSIDQDQFVVIDHRYEYSKIGAYIIVDTINRYGEFVNKSDTIFSIFEGVNWLNSYRQSWNKILFDERNQLYWVDFYVPQSTSVDTARAVLRIFGTNYKEIDLKHLDPSDDNRTWFILDVKKNYALIGGSTFNKEKKFYLLNISSGEIVYQGLYDSDFYELFLNNDGSVLLVENINGDQDSLWSIKFYSINTNGIKEISSFKIKNKNYFLVPSKILQIEDGRFLLSFLYSEYDNFSFKGRFMTDILVKPEDINFQKDEIDSHLFLTNNCTSNIYPNPVSESLIIGDALDFDDIIIYSADGKILQHQGSETKQIRLDHYMNGLYFLSYIKNNQIVCTCKFIVVNK